MANKKRAWQDAEYVLRFFGTGSEGRKAYRSYVKAGIAQGRREDLTGGGLVRSYGGWSEIKHQRQSLSYTSSALSISSRRADR